MAYFRCMGGENKYFLETNQQELVSQESELIGTVTSSSVYSSSWLAWYALSSGSGTQWVAGASDCWWQYEFPTDTNIYKFTFGK